MRIVEKEAGILKWTLREKEHIDIVHENRLDAESTYQHLVDSLSKLPRLLRYYILKSDGRLRRVLRAFILSGQSANLAVGIRVVCARTREIPGYAELCCVDERVARDVAALVPRISQHDIAEKAAAAKRVNVLRAVPYMAVGYAYRCTGGSGKPGYHHLEYAAGLARVMCSSAGAVHGDDELEGLALSRARRLPSHTYLALDYVTVYTLFGHTVATLKRRRDGAPIYGLVERDGDNAIAHRVAQFTLG